MNTTAVLNTIRPAGHSPAASTPCRDLLGCFALSAGLGAGLSTLAVFLSRLSPDIASGFHAFLGLG